MHRFSCIRERCAGHPQRGFPHPSGGSPSPHNSPPKGGSGTPQGAGTCRPPVRPSAAPSTPSGHPCGVPPACGRLPLPLGLSTEGGGGMPRPVPLASEARRADRPGVGVEKFQSCRRVRSRQAAWRWGCGEGRVAGGQGWGQPVGSACAVHGVSLLLPTGREAPAGPA